MIDALLGAGGLGDLGTHFPPDDETWRDADSLDLLRTTLGMLRGPVVNVDVTVICEQPRLAAHREQMERNLAEVLGAPGRASRRRPTRAWASSAAARGSWQLPWRS